MAVLALTAASVYISDVTLASGVTLPASENALTGKTGVTFPNQPAGAVVLRVVVGGAGAGNVTVNGQNKNPNKVIAVSNSTVYIFGPFDPALYSDQSGLVHVDFSVVTGNSVGVYRIPAIAGVVTTVGASSTLHNPFESVTGASDW